MRTHVLRHFVLLLAAGFAPGVVTAAHAGTIVLSPFLADPSVTPKQQAGLHQLIASELDFSSGVEGVVELKAPPGNLDDACLMNPGCLGTITQTNHGNQMLAGKMAATGSGLVLDMVFFDGRTIARRKQFQVPADASGMANAMTPIVQEMISGKGGAEPKAAAAVVAAPIGSDLDDGPAMADQIAPPAPAPANYSPPPAPIPVALPPPVPVAAPAVIDPSQISFKTSVADLSADQVNSMIKFGGPPAAAPPQPAMAYTQPYTQPAYPQPTAYLQPAPQPYVAPPPPPQPARQNGTRIAEEEAELDAMEKGPGIVDLDDEGRRGSGSRAGATGPTRSGQSTGTVADRLGHSVQVTARGGYSKYYGFNFVTGGGELGIAATGGLHLIAGFEVFAVHRVLPPDIAAQELVYAEWNTIYPGNVGFLYKYPVGIAQPYIGADAVFVQYYKDEVGADWAGGARGRAGIDLMFVPNFGININLAAGGWYGQNWPLIEQGTGAGGFLPQASGGTVIAF
jgi:hypothetical protein